jgi:hypothetical protein
MILGKTPDKSAGLWVRLTAVLSGYGAPRSKGRMEIGLEIGGATTLALPRRSVSPLTHFIRGFGTCAIAPRHRIDSENG